MKKILFGLIVGFVAMQGMVFAQTVPGSSSSATISPTESVQEKEIQNLTDKLATKVAELRKQNNTGMSGFVTKIQPNVISIKNNDEENYQVKLDDALTKYYQVTGTQIKDITVDDIKVGKFIIVSGVQSDNTISANSVYIDEMFLVKSGQITEVNTADYSLGVTSTEKDTYTLEIQTDTKQEIVDPKTLQVTPIGFSKIKAGDTIHFVVKKTGNEKDNTYSAVKILIIPQEYFMN